MEEENPLPDGEEPIIPQDRAAWLRAAWLDAELGEALDEETSPTTYPGSLWP